MSAKNIALSFNTAEYYSLQEASEYLNTKYNSDNVTPKKILKHMVSHDTPAYIHVSFKNESFKIIGDFETTITTDPEFKNFFKKPYESKNEDESKYWLNKFKEIEEKANNDLYSNFYLGLLLLKVSELTLFNLSFKNEAANVDSLGFDGILIRNDLEADPSKLSFLKREQDSFYVIGIGHFEIGIEDIQNVDLEDIRKYISLEFDSIFETSGGLAYPYFKLSIRDLVILHKDLLTLEEQIIENVAVSKKQNISINLQNLPKRKGVSPKKVLAQSLARHIADDEWKKDKNKNIKMLEMSNIVWSKLWELGFADTLPEQQRIREWIKGNAPDYASEGGRPRQK